MTSGSVLPPFKDGEGELPVAAPGASDGDGTERGMLAPPTVSNTNGLFDKLFYLTWTPPQPPRPPLP